MTELLPLPTPHETESDERRLTEIKQALHNADQLLVAMYTEYEQFTDGRFEMMENIRDLRRAIDDIRYDLAHHHAYVNQVVALIRQLTAQRTEAITERDDLLIAQKAFYEQALREIQTVLAKR